MRNLNSKKTKTKKSSRHTHNVYNYNPNISINIKISFFFFSFFCKAILKLEQIIKKKKVRGKERLQCNFHHNTHKYLQMEVVVFELI